jgi:hypothetical protein
MSKLIVITALSVPSLLCCRPALGDTYRRPFYGGLLSLPLTPCLEINLTLYGSLFGDRPDEGWWPPPQAGSAENSNAEVADLTFFPFSLVFRRWARKVEGLIWTPIITSLQRLEVSVIPSGKDQQEVTSSGL